MFGDKPKPDLDRLNAAFRLIRLQDNDKCDHCDKPIPSDVPAVTFLGTPPGSAVATIGYTCSQSCREALMAAGWANASKDDIARLKDQLEEFGARQG